MKRKLLLGGMMFILFFFFSQIVSAQVAEETPHISGAIEGIGKHFEVNDSEYLNITLDSSEEISAKIESIPEMIILDIKASGQFDTASVSISGFSTNTTYHKYQDGYYNYMPLVSNGNGTIIFEQDISQNHLIFIQPRKSTKIILNNQTGGDCTSIGNWNLSTKTCTLNTDVSETIQVGNDGGSDAIVLDGASHRVTGKGSGMGVYIYSHYATVKNITISGFTYGVYAYYRNGARIESSTIENNRNGIRLSYGTYGTKVVGNTIRSNTQVGIDLVNSSSNLISDNIVGPDNQD